METDSLAEDIIHNSKLEQLFGSKTRVKLLYFFFKNPNKAFFVRELTRKLDSQINSVRRELANLEDIGIVRVVEGVKEPQGIPGLKEKKYFQLNQGFILSQELKNLFLKSQLILEKEFVERIAGTGKIDYFILTGKFCGVNSSVDLFVVGSVDKPELSQIISEFEVALKSEINYTAMSSEDFIYRKSVSDRFVLDIIDKKKIIIIDNLSDLEAKAEED